MQGSLLAHVSFLGLIAPKHGVFFSQCVFFNIRAKNYTAYI
jgi:hypothetical protein